MGKYLLLLILLLQGCTLNNKTEVHQSERNNIINVKDKLKEIIGDDILIGGGARLDVLDQYLVVSDVKSVDTLYHVFDKQTFRYLNSVGVFGPGPNEITNPAPIYTDEKHRKFHIPDFGKNKVLSFCIDSVVNGSSRCLPEMNGMMDESQYPDRVVYFCDTLSLIRAITIPSNPGEYFKHSLARWNMKTGAMDFFPYSHPDIERKRIVFNASMEDDIVVEAYRHHDLFTIYDFDGNFKRNIYGSRWDDATSNDMIYFGHVMIAGGKIILSYAGGRNWTDEYYPTKFMVFDLEGNYIKTLDVGYKIEHCCLDKENSRIIMSLNAEIQFAYLDLRDFV